VIYLGGIFFGLRSAQHFSSGVGLARAMAGRTEALNFERNIVNSLPVFLSPSASCTKGKRNSHFFFPPPRLIRLLLPQSSTELFFPIQLSQTTLELFSRLCSSSGFAFFSFSPSSAHQLTKAARIEDEGEIYCLFFNKSFAHDLLMPSKDDISYLVQRYEISVCARRRAEERRMRREKANYLG
jgi:hypothetical protein